MTATRDPGADSCTARTGAAALVRDHPITALLLWFFTVGQAIAFIPVVSGLPIAPFVIASTLVGLLLPILIITGVTEGPDGLRLLWRRITAVRIGARWYALALVVVPLATLGVATMQFGPPVDTSPSAMGVAVLFGLLLPTVLGLAVTNLAEEAAWMGFVQTRLQDRRGPMIAAVLTAPLFALQHLPLVVSNADFAAAMLLLLLAVPFRALIGWAYNRTQSLFLVGLVHAAGNAVAGGRLRRGAVAPGVPGPDRRTPAHRRLRRPRAGHHRRQQGAARPSHRQPQAADPHPDSLEQGAVGALTMPSAGPQC